MTASLLTRTFSRLSSANPSQTCTSHIRTQIQTISSVFTNSCLKSRRWHAHPTRRWNSGKAISSAGCRQKVLNIQKFRGHLPIKELYAEMTLVNPSHVPQLDSILSPHMLSPFVAISHSIPGHRPKNWNFMFGMLWKLQLPIYDPSNCPRCWCCKTHDCWGDHFFSCTENNKTLAHHFIRDGWAVRIYKSYISAIPIFNMEIASLQTFSELIK